MCSRSRWRSARIAGPGRAKPLVTALRSLLGYLFVDGVIARPLAPLVPSVAGWRLAGLPRGLGAEQMTALLASCDRDTTGGARDFAILKLLIRRGEVAALTLDDIDWRCGGIEVRGKGSRSEQLPLPAATSLAADDRDLRQGRPRTAPRARPTMAIAGRCLVSPLRDQLSDYLRIRTALGYKLVRAEKLLAQFIAFLQERGEHVITIENTLAWVTLPGNSDSWRAHRLSTARGFAPTCTSSTTHTRSRRGICARTGRRAIPYLYSDQQIATLMAATVIRRGRLRQATFRTLIGVLAVTGMRVGEAIRLDRDDVDLAHGVLTVRDTKFGICRFRHIPNYVAPRPMLR